MTSAPIADPLADHLLTPETQHSWRTGFVNGMFLPTDVARREAFILQIPAAAPLIAAALLQAMAELDGVSALSQVLVPVLSVGSAAPANGTPEICAPSARRSPSARPSGPAISISSKSRSRSTP